MNALQRRGLKGPQPWSPWKYLRKRGMIKRK
jgi:hypothetical protein